MHQEFPNGIPTSVRLAGTSRQRIAAFAITITALAAMAPVTAHAQRGGVAAGGTVSNPITTPTVPVDQSTIDLAKTLDVTTEVAQQIQLIEADKDARDATHQKICSDFIYGARMAQGQDAVPGVPALAVDFDLTPTTVVTAKIRAKVNDDLLSAIQQTGGSVINVSGNEVIAKLPLLQVETLAARNDVLSIGRYFGARHHGNLVTPDLLSKWKSTPLVPPVARKQRTAQEREAALRHNLQKALNTYYAGRSPLGELDPDGFGVGSGLPVSGVNTVNTGTIGEGVTVHGVTALQNLATPIIGTGIRIGVMSDGDTYLAQSQASNDLPPADTGDNSASTTVAVDDTQSPAVTQDGPSGNSGEGTAMMQIVYDMAPGAKIFFASADYSEAQFAKNIEILRFKYHCDIICDDVYYFDEAPFSDGPIAQAVNQVTADGCLYFSSAGNEGHTSTYSVGKASTASCWEGDFSSGGAVTKIGSTTVSGLVHQFTSGSPGVTYDTASKPLIQGTVTSGGKNVNVGYGFLYWADPASGAVNDYDVFSTNSGGTTTFSADTTTQTDGTTAPYAGVYVPVGYRLYALKKNKLDSMGNLVPADVLALHLDTFGSSAYNAPSMTYTTNGQSFGHNATVNGFGVAAAPATNNYGYLGPYPSQFSTSSVSEYFTSNGPRKIFYNVSGGPALTNTVAPTGYTLPSSNPVFTLVSSAATYAAGGTIRNQPFITAADGVTSSSAFASGGGLNPFYGTSAAAPHAASIAALVKSYAATVNGVTIYGPNISVAEMKTIMSSTALDVEAAGYDATTGYGIVMPGLEITYLQNFLSTSPSASAITNTSATITWGTNLSSSSSLVYGPTTAYGTTASSSSGQTHSVSLTGLQPGTTYHYKVTSTTPTASLSYTSPSDLSFTTTGVSSNALVTVSGTTVADSGGTVTTQVTLTNSGTGNATNVKITSASLSGALPTQTLPLNIGTIAVSATGTASLTFMGQTSGTKILRVSGSDDSGRTFSTSVRISVP